MTQARDLADGKFDTNTLVVDAANNRVGINTTSPVSSLHLEEDTPVITLRDTSAYSAGTGPYVQFQGLDSGSTNRVFGQIYGLSNGSNSGELAFYTRNSGSTAERGRFLAGGGLTFNGDTAAANALDDYEEGTFTPSIGSADAYGTRTGRYTKVGRVVTVQVQVTFTQNGTQMGNLSGLPFALAGSSEVPVFLKEYNSYGTAWHATIVNGNSSTGNFRDVVNNSRSANNDVVYGFAILLTYHTA